MSKDIEQHEDEYVHIKKKVFGVILFGIFYFGSWGYLISAMEEIPEFKIQQVAIAFVILFITGIVSIYFIVTNNHQKR